jgi:DNA-directed RNA polymerase subunit RPC12/RpoP
LKKHIYTQNLYKGIALSYVVERKSDLIILVCGECGYRVIVRDRLESLGRSLMESHIKSVHKQ